MDAVDPFAVDRRTLLRRGGLAVAGTLTFGSAFWREALAAAPARLGPGPYGPLGAADANGISLPAGFRSREIARAGRRVTGTGYTWHRLPDGQATFPTPDGGFVLVSNSEVSEPGRGGASAIRFDAAGRSVDAYRILSGTTKNCAGGRTPWGTWMSCEEVERGLVWECDPTGRAPAIPRPAMGTLVHEALCVDPDGRRIYLSEDFPGGGFYRFTPRRWPDCSEGTLEIAVLREDVVRWTRVPDPAAATTPCREQVPGSAPFQKGEGIWFDAGVVYLATTADGTIWAYSTGTETMERLYHSGAVGGPPPFHGVDSVTVSSSGDLFVGEDPGSGPVGIGVITPGREAARFCTVGGASAVEGNDICGVVFDPSGTRMLFASQRAFGAGAIYEITGPFRRERIAPASGPPARLDVRPRLRLGEVRARGPRIGVRLGRPATVTARLQATLRGRRVTLARRRIERGLGPAAFRLTPSRAGRAALKGRRAPLRATLVVTVTDAAGRTTELRRAVTLARAA